MRRLVRSENRYIDTPEARPKPHRLMCNGTWPARCSEARGLGREAVSHYTKRRGGAARLGTSVAVHNSSSETKYTVGHLLLLLSVSVCGVCLWWWVRPCGRSIGVCCTWAMHSTKLCLLNQRVNRDHRGRSRGLPAVGAVLWWRRPSPGVGTRTSSRRCHGDAFFTM
jgi:hypothetical protein